ncbi:MAG: phosphate--acyl-ACP acyltransferase, partial [candidate division Zixibacteria bacterium]|nr:phosphate--acyl-ACP acyltransferase [candidate division Zixibacteria bacterium]
MAEPMRTILLDAMGGDHGPSVCVEAAVQAVRESPTPLKVILVGDERELRSLLGRYHVNGAPVEIVHAPDVVRMNEQPTEVFRRKDSSVRVAMR